MGRHDACLRGIDIFHRFLYVGVPTPSGVTSQRRGERSVPPPGPMSERACNPRRSHGGIMVRRIIKQKDRWVFLSLISGCVFLLPAVSVAQTVSFSFPATTALSIAGGGPRSLAIGDLNRDGIPDLAVANQSSSTVSILLGTGTGLFGAATDFPGGLGAVSVALGDLNRDGKLDLAVADPFSGTVSVLLGTGTGSFGTATTFAVGSEPTSVAIGEFNGDGKLDLAVANYNGQSVSILLGTGTGSFGTAATFAVGDHPLSVAIGDLNCDGKSDLAVANQFSNTVSILLGDGTGSFGTAANYAVGTYPLSVAIGDLNGDGKADLAVANFSSSTVSVLLGTGAGSFGTAVDFPVGNGPQSVAIGDLNGDGKLDLETANSYNNTVSTLLGTGTGVFGSPIEFAAGSDPRFVAIGDLNRDGTLDLAVANHGDNDVAVLLNITPNLVRNPFFESDTGGWGAYAGSTISRIAGGYDGAYSLQVSGPATTAAFGVDDYPNWVASTPAAGTRYRVTVWVRSAGSAGKARLRVREYLNGVKQGVATYSAQAVLSPSWQMLTMDYVAASAGSTLDLQIMDAPATTGEAFQVDNVSLWIVP
ncbi:MAG: VCBS repeat-containing protein [Nitrospirae bacterium]|nr:VCBS repeat-containing protein [Nitrospirota bacterium]